MWADPESAQGCAPSNSFRKIACSVTFITIQFGRVFKYRFNSRWLSFWAETDRWTKASLKLLRCNCLIFFCTTSENNKSILQQDFQRCIKAGISTGATWLVLPKSLWEMLPQRLHHCCVFYRILAVPLDGCISQQMRLFSLEYEKSSFQSFIHDRSTEMKSVSAP